MTKPYPFQKEGVKLISKYKGRALLADEMGLGKTIQSLVWMRLNKTYSTIVICPAELKINWKNECLQHINMKPDILYGMKPQSNQIMLGNNGSKPTITIINYRILKAWMPYLLTLNAKLVIIDECHFIKNPSAQRTKMVRQLCKKVPNIIALSGTPLTNRPAELFPILKLLRPKIYSNFMEFAREFCRIRRTRWGWDFRGAKNLDRLHNNLTADYKNGGLMIRRLKKDVLKQLPKKSRFVVPLQIQNRKEYLEAEHDFIKWLTKQSVSKAKKASKAKQLVRFGYLKRLAVQLKLKYVFKWIDSFLQESDEKIILYTLHKKTARDLHEKYKKSSVVLDGSTPTNKREMVLEKFKRNKKIRILIGHMAVAGIGRNITQARYVAFVELDYVPGNHLQAEDRTHRIGQTKKVLCYYLVADRTIESDLCELLQKKQVNIETTLDGGAQIETLDIFDQLQKRMKKRSRKHGRKR